MMCLNWLKLKVYWGKLGRGIDVFIVKPWILHGFAARGGGKQPIKSQKTDCLPSILCVVEPTFLAWIHLPPQYYYAFVFSFILKCNIWFPTSIVLQALNFILKHNRI